jgi:hypothetical protein
MYFSLINYTGLDSIHNIDNFDYIKPYKLEGSFSLENNIYDLFSFSLSKEFVDYKNIKTFNDINLDDEGVFGNIVIIQTTFNLSFEYSNTKNNSILNIFNKNINDCTFVSLEDYENENLDINLFTTDLHCCKLNENEIFYSINMLICINKL